MASSPVLLLACLALVASATAQLCPLTGLPPAPPNTPFTRCLDAREKTCCADCTDISTGLAMVSANASNMLQNISPVLLPALKGEDLTFCTVVYPAAKCQDTLEQMACAITCNPESYTYINMTTRTMTLCQNFTDELVSSCKYAQITGNTAVNNQTFLGNTVANKYFVQALSNIVTGLLGMTRFTMAVGNDTMCYAGPVKAPKTKVCCDELTVSPNCPANTVNFTAKPNLLTFSGKDVDNNTCRAATPFTVAPLPPLSNGTVNGTNGSAWALGPSGSAMGPSGSLPNITSLISSAPPSPANGASPSTTIRMAAGAVVTLLAAAALF